MKYCGSTGEGWKARRIGVVVQANMTAPRPVPDARLLAVARLIAGHL